MRIGLIASMLVVVGLGTLFILSQGERPPSAERVPAPEAASVASSPAPASRREEAAGSPEASGRRRADARSARSDTPAYYQFVDESGSVRFVRSLDEVPPAWRERAGRVELGESKPSPPAARRSRGPRPFAAPIEKRVVVYTTSWCGWCRKALAHLDRSGVPYVNKDIERDPRHRDELRQKTGRTSIPVVEIDGQLILGYDPDRMDRLLGS